MESIKPDTTAENPSTAWEQGRLLRLAERPAEALKVLQQGLASEANDYRLHDEIGSTLFELNRNEEAIGSFFTVLRLKPDFDEACNKIGLSFAARGLLEPAAQWFSRARAMNPDSTKYLYSYGTVLVWLGNLSQAAEVFGQCLKAEPDNPFARHFAGAALGGQPMDRASAEYVCALFDDYADDFDENLVRLKYRGPELVCSALQQVAELPVSKWEILDAGCGTGLSGIPLRSLASRLVGIDLSAGMLQIARQRNLYDELVQADIIEHLSRHKQDFDVITAVDVLSYIGDLSDFFSYAAQALRPGGLVAFAIEAHKTDENYRLNLNGRFSHCQSYVRSVMETSGFKIAHFAEDVLRHEGKKPVASWVATGVLPGV